MSESRSTMNVSGEALYPHIETGQAERILEAVILSIICLVAISGNTLLWLAILSTKPLRTNSNIMILCLSTADILVSVVTMPTMVYTISKGYWNFSDRACVGFGFITMLTFVASVMSLGAISISRYVLICHYSKFRTIYTNLNTGLIIFATWALSFLLATPPLIGWGRYGFLPGQSFCFCQWRTSISYTYFMVGACFGGPCAMMTFSYVNILKVARKSKETMEQYRSSQVSVVSHGSRPRSPPRNAITPINCPTDIFLSDDESSFSFESSHRTKETPMEALQRRRREQQQKARKDDLKLTISLLVVIFIFVICWLPFCVTMFWSVYSAGSIPRIPDIATVLLGCLNSACNPIVYGVLNPRFRNAYVRLLRFRPYQVTSDYRESST